MKKIILGLFLVSCQMFATPKVALFTDENPNKLQDKVNKFIYNRKKTIKVIDIKYQSDANFQRWNKQSYKALSILVVYENKSRRKKNKEGK